MDQDRSDDEKYQGVCDCFRLLKPPGTSHEPWCAFLRPRAPDVIQRPSTAAVLQEITGGEAQEAQAPSIYGIPEAIGTSEEFPLTSRPGEYLGQPRETRPLTAAEAGLPPWLAAGMDFVLFQPAEIQLINDVKQGEAAGVLRTAIDRYMAAVYDQLIDELAERRRVHTKRLGH